MVLSGRMSGKLTLLFTLFWVWTAVDFPIRCPQMHGPESGCVCLSFSQCLCSRKKCLVLPSWIISDCLLDSDVAFCWLGCLHWNNGHKYCPENGLFSEWPSSNALLVFRELTYSLSVFCPSGCMELDKNSEHQIQPSHFYRRENWGSKFTIIEPFWESVIMILLELWPLP